MPSELHHMALFVSDMERSLRLFRDHLGFQPVWRVPSVGGRKMAMLMGIQGMKAEMAFLRGPGRTTALELVRMIAPETSHTVAPATAGPVGLSISVDNLDGLRRRLEEEGWVPCGPCMDMRTPEGDCFHAFCFRTDEGVLIELIQWGNEESAD